ALGLPESGRRKPLAVLCCGPAVLGSGQEAASTTCGADAGNNENTSAAAIVRVTSLRRANDPPRLRTVGDEVSRVGGHDRRGGGSDARPALSAALVEDRVVDIGVRAAV